MSHKMSLTDAVKMAAVTNLSLTEAVKDAARVGEGCTVIPFPRPRLDDDSAEPIPEAHRADDDVQPLSDARPEPHARAQTQEPPAAPWRPAEAAPAVASRALASLPKRCARLLLAGVLALGVLTAGARPLGSGSPPPQPVPKRVALVIGNAAYQFSSRLDNPRNDASDVATALRRLGFQVTEGLDLDKAAFDKKVRDFANALQGADVAVFFYAGHGLQVSGQNYLVPVDAQLGNQAALDFEMVRLDLVHRTMEREAKTNILFFDACRHNPLARNLARAMGTTRSLEIGRGLAQVEAGAGTLISFSTQPGNVALDGTGRNSPFSGALVRQLNASSDDVGAILIAVRNDVMKETERKQVPWEHSALTGRFYFNPAGPAPAGLPPSAARSTEAAEAWSAAKDTRNVAVLEAFVLRYRDTFFAELARARIEELRRPDPGRR